MADSPRATEHALARFIRRWYPGRGIKQARRELERRLAAAERIGPCRDGELWLAPGGMRVVVRSGMAVTVLPPPQRRRRP